MKIKDLNQFTIKEFNEYVEITNNQNGEHDIFDVLEMFGVENAYDLPLNEFNKIKAAIELQEIRTVKPKKYYKINGKEYYAELNITKLTAGQFIDLQIYMSDFKLEKILSIFLLPVEKKWFKKSHKRYNENYDIVQVQADILNYFNICDANSLSSFFLHSSKSLLGILNNSLMRKLNKKLKEKEKREEKQEKT